VSASARFWQVDAFTDRPFAGNPAAVLLLDEALPDATMAAIAAENNLAETAFVEPAGADGVFGLRWFTPTVEIALCGHATLASGHVLLGEDPARDAVRFRTRQAGELEVRRASAGYAMDLPAWGTAPRPLPAIVAALGVEGAPETHWRDGGYAVVMLPDEAAVRALRPDFAALAACGNVLTIVTAPGNATDVASRVFAPGAGIDEDHVTGSAHAVIAGYWAERLGRTGFSAFQTSARGGRMEVELAGDRVTLQGKCVTVIEGRFRF